MAKSARAASCAFACRGNGPDNRRCCKAAPPMRKVACSRRARSGSRATPPTIVFTTTRSSAGRWKPMGAGKMSTRRHAAIALFALAACATPPATTVKAPALGEPATEDLIARFDISIPPSGAGLPKGSGSVRDGQLVYEQKCMACHGAKGVGKPADTLVGGVGSLASKAPLRTVGSYWPYSTTLFDYVRRAMPLTNPLSLSDNEVYAVSAYVLYLNGIVAEDATMDAQSLPKVSMPNRNGFVSDWPPRSH